MCDHVLDYAPSVVDTPPLNLTTSEQEISSGDLEQLRTNLPRCLSDGLFKKLLDLEEVCVSVCVCVCLSVCMCMSLGDVLTIALWGHTLDQRHTGLRQVEVG